MLQPFPQQLLNQKLWKRKKKERKKINFLLFRHCQRSSLFTHFCLFWHNAWKLHHPFSFTLKRHHHTQHWRFGNLTSSLLRNKYCFGLSFSPFLPRRNLVPATSWDSLQSWSSNLWQMVSQFPLYVKVASVRWADELRCVKSNFKWNSAVWHRFFNSETYSPTPCARVLQGHPERSISATQQSELCPPSSSHRYFTWEQQCNALPN